GPTTAAEEEYAKRAYPAAYIPFELTRNAHVAWSDVRARALARVTQPLGQWTLVGPTSANDPEVLTFSGAPYTTSGRITALALAPNCDQAHCTLYLAAAGGGIWKTNRALDTSPSQSWNFISGSFATNAIGTLVIDATDPTGNTLYAGTGESHASADSEAGFGIYKTTNGGDTWTHLAAHTDVAAGTGVNCNAIFGTGGFRTAPAYSGPAFDGRAISSIVIDRNNPSVIYVGSTRAVRGVSSVLSGGVVSLAPGLPPYGLWKSTDGGANFTLLNYKDVCLNPTLPGDAGIIQSSFGSTRGVNRVASDPSTSSTIYAAAFPQNNATPLNTKGGVWRSRDAGASWRQIKSALNPALNTDRAEFAVTKLANGNTRMYVGDGNTGSPDARFYRSDDVATGSPTFTDLTTDQNIGYCTGQCWYDNVVYSPPGRPGTVYLGGSFSYATYGFSTNGRAFLRSSDAGASFTDMTWDATTKPTPPGSCCQPNSIAPNGMHPDSHAVVEVPDSNIAFFGSDGGIVRSSVGFSDISSQCTTERGLTGADLALCQQLLSAVPTRLFTTYNDGLSTLQFQSVSVNPSNANNLMGGTQDNGTFEKPPNSTTVWPQKIYGDGGQSGFNVGNPALRFNSFFLNLHDVNFRNGNPLKWVIASGPIVASGESSQFYAPIIADPVSAGTIFQGSQSVWRTRDWAGNQAFLEANCPEFTTSAADPKCGDFVRIGPAGATDLTASAADYRGTTRAGGNVAALARAGSDTSTLWAATTTGRVFISKNADAGRHSVTYTRLDSLVANSPGRFISGISVDPADPNHAYLAYSSYSALTPSTPGHVFSVMYNPGAGTATWTKLDGTGGPGFPDFPATGIAFDSATGDLYVSNDWGVLRLPNGSSDWEVAGTDLPMVEVAGLTIVPSARKLYAATHGRSAWLLTLP
ncbi:MAG: WD40/YVTN/BNR-like repeat-containing protein, partial [Bryobacteraceae bacterium]